MDEKFKDYEDKKYSSRSRSSRIEAIEKAANINIDEIINDDYKVYTLLKNLKNIGNTRLNIYGLHEHHCNLKNSIRVYYVYKHGKKFPSISNYEKRVISKNEKEV